MTEFANGDGGRSWFCARVQNEHMMFSLQLIVVLCFIINSELTMLTLWFVAPYVAHFPNSILCCFILQAQLLATINKLVN